jgi:DNA invertase Pin-like site-specific DNA recombinase
VAPTQSRGPGFAELLSRIEGNGVCTVIVEDASRFARDLVAQELGILLLINRGVRVVTANGDDLTDTSDPSRVMMRQIAGSFAQYEKARLVAKLRTARERKRKTAGKCEGRKSWAEINPELVRQAKRLRRRSPKGHQRSLRDIARELEGLVMSINTASDSRLRLCSQC